jgi:hypothetical protein
MPSVASVRLTKRDNSELTEAIIPKNKRTVNQPQQALYGIYGSALAQELASQVPGGGETLRIAHENELRRRAANEMSQYRDDLAAANAAQERLTNLEGYYDIYGDLVKEMPAYVDRGIGRALSEPIQDEQGRYHIPIAPDIIAQGDRSVLNQGEADRLSTMATAVGTMADKTGIIPDTGYLSELYANPESDPSDPYGGKVPLQEGFKSPELQVKEYGTDQGLTFEQQLQLVREKAVADGDDIGEITVKHSATGDPLGVDYKGTPEQVAKARQKMIDSGMNPDTGERLNPNAGANGGDAPAKKAAKDDPTIKPVDDARAIMLKTHGIKPTSFVRDPNSKLGRANPKSYHNHTRAAIDASPRQLRAKYGKDYSFNQYVDSYKKQGYSIIEALDEEKHPVKDTTGPNWHVVLGQKRDTSQMYAARFKLSPLVASATPIGDGSVVVKMKDGSQRVYKNGKRVG